jgi:hypothetical protein
MVKPLSWVFALRSQSAVLVRASAEPAHGTLHITAIEGARRAGRGQTPAPTVAQCVS